jgi:hypothetical protein
MIHMSWTVAGIFGTISALFMWWVEGIITSPLEDIAIQQANTTAQYGVWWFGHALGLALFGLTVMSLLAIFNR